MKNTELLLRFDLKHFNGTNWFTDTGDARGDLWICAGAVEHEVKKKLDAVTLRISSVKRRGFKRADFHGGHRFVVAGKLYCLVISTAEELENGGLDLSKGFWFKFSLT